VLRKSRGFSLVWIVPIVAAAVGIWLAVTTVMNRGPLVSVTFVTAEGLEAGKTKVKYRDVDVGTVEAVRVTKDLKGILVEARMEKSFAPNVTENSRFWVVRPRVGFSGVTGLGTLLSGAYIEVEPAEGASATSFVGLEEPPLIRSDVEGTQFKLVAENLGSVDRGAPVYYRGFEVGQILGHKLSDDGKRFEIPIFVRSPHDKLVVPDSHFWDVSGISFRAGADGIDLKIASVASLIAGGVEFSSPDGRAGPAAAGTTFTLFPDESSIGDSRIAAHIPYIIDFDGSVRGLQVGAPVEFRGIRTGTVTQIELIPDFTSGKAPIRVYVDLEPQRFANSDPADTIEEQYERTKHLVSLGLRAQLKTGNLLTGDLFIAMNLMPDAPPAEVEMIDGVPLIPSVPTDLEALTASISGLLDRLSSLPIEDIVQSLQRSAATIENIVADPDVAAGIENLAAAGSDLRSLIAELEASTGPMARSAEAAVAQAQQTMQSVDAMLGQNSTLRYQLERVLQELTTAARSIRSFADMLDRDPSAIIRGRRE
jgi:paraquat-inducible protein B